MDNLLLAISLFSSKNLPECHSYPASLRSFRPFQTVQFETELLSSLRWTGWPICRGIGDRFAVEWVSSLPRKTQRIFVSPRGIESTGYLINHTGAWSMYLLCIGLAVTPARKLFAWPWLARLRGMLGLFAFFYVCLHVFIVVWLEHDFDPALVWHHLGRTSANVMDAIAFVLLIPLALTSNQATKRLLGGARWKRLHSMVYVIVPLAAARFWAGALTSGQWGETIAFGIIIAALLGIRLYWRIGQPQYA